MVIDWESSEGDVITFPAKYEVCETCHGEGKHSHCVDGNGISREEFDEDPDFAESYFAGHYDRQCEECNGKRVVLTIDREHANAEDLALYDAEEEEIYQCDRMSYLERQMGC